MTYVFFCKAAKRGQATTVVAQRKQSSAQHPDLAVAKPSHHRFCVTSTFLRSHQSYHNITSIPHRLHIDFSTSLPPLFDFIMFSLQIIIAIMALFLVVGLANIADAILLVVAALVVAIGAVFAVAVAFFAIVSCCTRFSCRRRDDVAIDKPSPSPSPSTASDCDSDSGDDYKYAPTPLSQDAYLLKCKTFDQWIDLSRLYGRQRPLGHNAPNPQHQHNFTPFEPISRLTTTQPLARPLPPFSYGSYSSNWTNYGVLPARLRSGKRVCSSREKKRPIGRIGIGMISVISNYIWKSRRRRREKAPEPSATSYRLERLALGAYG